MTRTLNAIICLAAAVLLFSSDASAQFFGQKKVDLLPETEAFGLTAVVNDAELRIQWSIADNYYMYRDQFGVSPKTPGLELGSSVYPEGVIEQDPEFGEVEVYFYNVEIVVPIESLPATGSELELEVLGQGCNKPVGVCYPPQIRKLKIPFTPNSDLSEVKTAQESSASTETGFSAASNTDLNKSFWAFMVGTFVVGILLSFTPCVLPMIPILMAIIAGQEKPGRMASGFLALSYSAGHIFVYAIAGWVIALGGGQIQAYFQNPYMIGSLCILLVHYFSRTGELSIWCV